MRRVFEHWREQNTGREGCSVAYIKYQASFTSGDVEEYGKERMTLKAAINDGARMNEKYGSEASVVDASADILMLYSDGNVKCELCEESPVGCWFDGEFCEYSDSANWL